MYITPLPELKINRKLLLDFHSKNFAEGNWDHPTLFGEPVWQMMRMMNFTDSAPFQHIIDQFAIPITLDMFRIIQYVDKSSLSIHKDERKATINVILTGDNEQVRLCFFDENRSILFKMMYTDCPVLINTTKYHNLENKSEIDRIILSITFDYKSEYDYDKLYDLYVNNKLIVPASKNVMCS